MYISTIHHSTSRGILNFMPQSLRKYMYRINFEEAYEIRMSLGKPLMLYYNDGTYYLSSAGFLTKSTKGAIKITRQHLDEALELATKSSVYAKQQNISEGFITIDGGHRIGICGSGVVKDGTVTFIKDISTLNYRLALEVKGCAGSVIDEIYKNGSIKNTLIIAPPGAGKTTLLRDIVRELSNKGIRISVVDERSEIACLYEGRTSFDMGINTDILDGIDKHTGMMMVLRSMSPQAIATDELGNSENIKTIKTIINCGVKIIATIHGFDVWDIKKREDTSSLIDLFDIFIVLSRDTKTSEFKTQIIHKNECT